MTPRFFASAGDFRRWLERHHASETELWVGYYKKASGKGGMVYAEALEQALCFGWIDGVVKSLDDERYIQRFTPRRPRSYWSAVNIRRMQTLIERGLVAAAGIKAFEARSPAPPGKYSNEDHAAAFDAAMLRQFKANRQAWSWFETQSPSFRRLATHWVTSAKKPETRAARLAELIDRSARGERPKGFIPPAKRTAVTPAPSGCSSQDRAAPMRRDPPADRRASHSDRSRARR